MPGLRIPRGSKLCLTRSKSDMISGAVDPREQPRAQPAVAVLARRRAAEPHHRVGDLLEQERHAASQPGSVTLGSRFTWT